MATLITGAAGQIGINLTKELLKRGKKVIAVDNFITGSKKNFSLVPKEQLQFIECKTELLKIDQPLTEIYHLACPTGVPNLKTIPEEMISACVLGITNILNIAKEQKVPFLFTSSSEVYGSPEVMPQPESYTGNVDPLGERAPYEEGKRIAETITATYVRKYGVQAKIVRVFNSFGPHFSEKDERVIPIILKQALHDLPITIHGDGSQQRTFISVFDLIPGLFTVMEKGIVGEAYNLGSKIKYTILELAKTIIKTTNSKSIIQYTERPPHDHNKRQPDLTKIHSLGWKQKLSLEDGIKLAVEYISQQEQQDPSA